VRTAKDSSADVATVDVQDTGMGISEQHLANIFEPFMQVHKTSTENSRGGIGLGLSIVKKHLEQIGGTITVESELGKGSTFRVVIPRNYDKQKSRKGWLKSLVKSKPTQPSMAVAALNPRPDTKEREVAGTRRAVG
jgi:K+-sensing histidine kinase KdpD